MTSIITTTEVQQKIGQISANIAHKNYIVTNRGKAKIVMLPYFDGCDRLLEDYLEDYEIFMNREIIEKKLQESRDSGVSDLVI